MYLNIFATESLSYSPFLVVRLTIVVIVNRLIRTPSRSLIQVVPQIDEKLLVCTNVPGTRIRPGDAGSRPLQPVTLPCKRAIRVLGLGEGDAQAVIVDIPSLADDTI